MDDLLIETPFGRVFANSAGQSGRPLALGLHGWSRRNGRHTWEPLFAPLAAAGFWAVGVDMPGWGRSVPIRDRPMSNDLAVSVVLAILDGLEVSEAAALMGKSWGGGLALMLALDYPARVEKLILTAPAFSDFARLPEMKQPVLLAWAEDDPVIPISEAERYRVLPNMQLATYPTGGHSAAPNNAADFAPRAVRFLQA